MALPYLDTASGTSTNICTIAVTDFNTFQVSASGDMVTVTVAVTFKVAPAQPYELYMSESYQDNSYLSSGVVPMDTVRLPAAALGEAADPFR